MMIEDVQRANGSVEPRRVRAFAAEMRHFSASVHLDVEAQVAAALPSLSPSCESALIDPRTHW